MKTKIVYVAISRGKDIYMEQVWASVFTLRHYNPTAHTVLLTDSESVDPVRGRAGGLLTLFDEVVEVPFHDASLTPMERSRWIKTSMRSLVGGDFLFVDADTFVAAPLDEIDSIPCSVGAVPDYHCSAGEMSAFRFFRRAYVERMNRVFGGDFILRDKVYNSGVMLVRDDDMARRFFRAWHANWLVSRSRGVSTDQLSLAKTCADMDYPVTELPGVWNCQLRQSVQYLYRAKIVHVFTTPPQPGLSPLFGDAVYRQIQREGCVSGATAQRLLGCKEAILSPSFLLDSSYLHYRYTGAHSLLCMLTASRHPVCRALFEVIEFVSRSIAFVLRHLHIH